MTLTSTHDLDSLPTFFDGTYVHLDPECADAVGPLSSTSGFGVGFPCSCADDVIQSNFAVGSGVAARLAGNVPGSTYSLPSGGNGTGHGSAPRPPSDKQVSYLRSLLIRKAGPAAGSDDVMTALASGSNWTSKSVSKMIDDLLATPDFVGSTSAPVSVRPNRYAAECRRCHGTVPAGEGSLLRDGTSWVVEHVGDCPAKTSSPAPSALPDVPEGHYAYPSSGSNDLSFVRVDRPTEGRWAGRVFVKQVIGGHPDQPVARANVASVLASIVEFGVDLAAQTYGQEIGRCYRCNRHLTDETSRQLGIGPDCRSRS